ncbi:DeoR family transcriptional regulator [Escherichia coli]|uniref:DeoR family transcriptional regulator n=1 Tax=Escherichia coli TaxID=562 RepID=A0A484Z2N5_ECOLX|nr:DeoR family transcriptional regulator [Escherichia coli]
MLVSGGVQSPGRVAHEPSHQVKTALAMTQKAAIGKLAQVLFSRDVVSIWMQERPR